MNDRTIILTGAAGGIGSAIVGLFTSLEDQVIGIDLPGNSCPEVSTFLPLDLHEFCKHEKHRRESIAKIKSFIKPTCAKLVLINNAAEQILAPAENLTSRDWDSVLSINTLAPFFLTQGLLSLLEETSGHVFNITSIHSKLTKPGFTAYATSKAALEGLTKSLAVEWGARGIKINAISPAAVDTPMLLSGFGGDKQGYADLCTYHPTESIARPVDIALLIKQLIDADIKFLNGSIIDFSGGISSRLHDPK